MVPSSPVTITSLFVCSKDEMLQENTNRRVSQDYVERQQAVLEKELARVQTQLKISHKVRQRLNVKIP